MKCQLSVFDGEKFEEFLVGPHSLGMSRYFGSGVLILGNVIAHSTVSWEGSMPQIGVRLTEKTLDDLLELLLAAKAQFKKDNIAPTEEEI